LAKVLRTGGAEQVLATIDEALVQAAIDHWFSLRKDHAVPVSTATLLSFKLDERQSLQQQHRDALERAWQSSG